MAVKVLNQDKARKFVDDAIQEMYETIEIQKVPWAAQIADAAKDAAMQVLEAKYTESETMTADDILDAIVGQ